MGDWRYVGVDGEIEVEVYVRWAMEERWEKGQVGGVRGFLVGKDVGDLW